MRKNEGGPRQGMVIVPVRVHCMCNDPLQVWQELLYPLVLSTLCCFPHFLSSAVCTHHLEKADLCFILDDYLKDFPNHQVLVNLAHGKNVFMILQTSFGESFIFQLFP